MNEFAAGLLEQVMPLDVREYRRILAVEVMKAGALRPLPLDASAICSMPPWTAPR